MPQAQSSKHSSLAAELRKLHTDIVECDEGRESPMMALVRRAADALKGTAETEQPVVAAAHELLRLKDLATDAEAIETSGSWDAVRRRDAMFAEYRAKKGDAWDALRRALAGKCETVSESVSLDYQLPCDVRLPPSATFGKGITLRTLMSALRLREKEPVFFDDEQSRAVLDAINQLRTGTAPGEEMPRRSLEISLQRHMKWRAKALEFFHQILDGRGTEDEWPALAEFVQISETVPRVAGEVKASSPTESANG